MKLIDQRGANPFYVRMNGEQPCDRIVDPVLPAEVDAPSSWPHASALLMTAHVNSDGIVLGNIWSPVPDPASRGSWCVWRRDGSLVHALDSDLAGERLIDAAWAGAEVVELRWAREDVDDYVVVVGDRRARFAVTSKTRMSAQSLAVLRAPTQWMVWLASGHGESRFDLVELRRMERWFSLAPEHGDLYNGAMALSDDGVLVFAAYGADGPQMVIVEQTGTRIVPFAVRGHPDDWSMVLTGGELVVTAGDRTATFPRPLVGPFAI